LPEATAQGRHSAIAFILATVALDATGIGILIPITPTLIRELGGGGLDQAALYGGWLTALFAIVQFGAGPILGSLSDHYGRRPVLLTSIAAFGLSYVLMGLAPSLLWLFIAQFLAGLFSATHGTASAYLADVTPPAERARRFGMMGAAFGFGLIVGPVLGGLLVELGTRLPFFVSAALSLANMLFGALVLPESLALEHRRPFHWSNSHPVGAFLALRRHLGTARLILGVLIMQVAMQTLTTTWPYFTMHKLGWTPRTVGLSLGVFGLSTVIVQAFVTGNLSRRLGNLRTAELGFLMVAAGYVGYALGSNSAMVFACIPLTVLGFVTQPALVGLMSAQSGASMQGALQGVVASAGSLAAIFTPLVMPALFSFFARTGTPWYFPGAPFLVAAGLALAGSLIVLRGARAGQT